MEELIAAAQAEGTLTTIALPLDWCDYGAVIDGFKAKYGLEVNGLDPGAGSAEELEAISCQPGQSRAAGARCDRRWTGLRAPGQGAGFDRSLQGGDLG